MRMHTRTSLSVLRSIVANAPRRDPSLRVAGYGVADEQVLARVCTSAECK